MDRGRLAPAARPRALALFALVPLLVAGCGEAPLTETLFEGPIMGTWYHVKLVTERPLGEELRSTTEALIRSRLDRVDRAMSTYRADSSVSRFNAADAGDPVRVDTDTVDVLKMASRVSEETGGAFDVTVGPLVRAWGFGPDGPRERPDEATLEALRARVGWRRLELVGSELEKPDPGIEIDLSAIAKGYAVDLVLESLPGLAKGAMVEVGGEIRVSGINRNREPWHLAIESPTAETRGIQRVLELTDMAIATSGDYRNFYERDGKRYSHIIDPATGAPVAHPAASVSVLHPQCAFADGYATALLVMGPERGLAWARERNLPVLYLVYNEEGGVDELATPVMADRLGLATDELGRLVDGPTKAAA